MVRHLAVLLTVASLAVLATSHAIEPEVFEAQKNAAEPPLKVAGLPEVLVPNPDIHARLAVRYLSGVPKSEHCHLRFLSYYDVSRVVVLPLLTQVMKSWVPSMSREPEPIPPKEVKGSNGRLFVIDLREQGWSPEGFQAVAEREKFFTEPWIESSHASYLRSASGVIPKTENGKVHCQAIVHGFCFWRESIETARSPAYYDLLFGKERYEAGEVRKVKKKVKKVWPGGKDDDGREFPKGYVYEEEAEVEERGPAKFVDFPATEDDWEKFFGADVVAKFLRERKISLRSGAIVDGGEVGGSIVAEHNRLMERHEVPFGAYHKTYDVDETAGDKDFTERLIFNFKYVAGEFIANLPNGSQAYFLALENKKRIEFPDANVARDIHDPHNPYVRTAGSCVICHDTGILKPEDRYLKNRVAGLELKFKEPRKRSEVRSFFSKHDQKIKADQDRYAQFLKQTSDMTGKEFASAFKELRSAYDAPVGFDGAAASIGVPPDTLKIIIASPKFVETEYGPQQVRPSGRATMLLQGEKISRRTFDKDVYSELQLLRLISLSKRPAKELVGMLNGGGK